MSKQAPWIVSKKYQNASGMIQIADKDLQGHIHLKSKAENPYHNSDFDDVWTKELNEQAKQADRNISQMLTLEIIVTSLVALVAVCFFFWIQQNISQPPTLTNLSNSQSMIAPKHPLVIHRKED